MELGLQVAVFSRKIGLAVASRASRLVLSASGRPRQVPLRNGQPLSVIWTSLMSDQDISGIGMCLYFRAILSAGERSAEAGVLQVRSHRRSWESLSSADVRNRRGEDSESLMTQCTWV